MGVIVSVIAGVIEIAGLFMVGHAWFRSATSGQEIYSGNVQQLRGPLRPFEIDLDPAMNPVEFAMSVQVDGFYMGGSHSEERHHYRATLSLNRKPVMDQVVELKSDAWGGDEKRKQPMRNSMAAKTIGRFEVASAGRHQFALSSAGGSIPLAFHDVQVTVRRNVKGVNMKQLWWGVGMIITGGLLQMIFGAPLPGKQND